MMDSEVLNKYSTIRINKESNRINNSLSSINHTTYHLNKGKGLSCLIPFYNEGERIIKTLEVLNRIDGISQILCVDDGSTDHMADVIYEMFPSVTLLRLAENGGKAEAVRQGLSL